MTEANRAAAGASFLDQQSPGWHRQMDTGSLNIARSDRCALGQLYGSYHRGLQVTGTASRSAELGFAASGSTGNPDEYTRLTQAWVREIESRLDAERAQWARDLGPVRTWTFRKQTVSV
jgi:hypothetical protein